MTLSEFRYWLEGYLEGLKADQSISTENMIASKLKEINQYTQTQLDDSCAQKNTEAENRFEKEVAYQELQKAIEIAGGQSALARICGYPVQQQHVWNWLHRDGRIAAQYATILEEELKGQVKHYRLRPDLFKKRFLESFGKQS